MKKIILSIGIVGLIFSCSDEYYESLNEDPTLPSDVPASFLVNAATKSLFDQLITSNQNLNAARLMSQYWTQTTYTEEANYDLNTRNITGQHWTRIYTNVLYDLHDAKDKINSYEVSTSFTAEDKANNLAIVEIIQIYTWQQLVDTFGNVPYSEAFQGYQNTAPKFDDAHTIYNDLLNRLTIAINSFEANGKGIDGDAIYDGNIMKWEKFANSLKLKIAMRLADVDPSTASSAANQAINSGVFTSNADNFALPYMSTQPNTNPLWEDLVLSGRADFVAANTLIDIMNNLDDPRKGIYFRDNLGTNTFLGGVYGDSGNTYSNSSQPGNILHEPTLPGTIMDYAEISFLLAEAVERGFIGGSAETFYNNGILASLNHWGVSTADANNYLSRSDVAYTTANGNWKEKIGRQFYLAMYNNAMEGWAVCRKFDYPVLADAASSGLPSPNRYTYPISERTLNPQNYTQAAAAIGGDEQSTKLFWDVN